MGSIPILAINKYGVLKMVTTNDKISLIIDADNLFNLNDSKVQDMINGDTFIINELYRKSLNFIKENRWNGFRHSMTKEIMTLEKWMEYYRCNINDPKSIVIFLRLAEPILI